MNGITQEEFDEIRESGLTLNGNPAWVTGRLNAWATVSYRNQTRHGDVSYEFSWATVVRCAKNGGNLKT